MKIEHSTMVKTQPRHSSTLFYIIAVINTFLLFAIFFWMAQTRNIDGDEGLYLEAARLVAQGKKLYFDFFFQQMPVIPYLYSGWMKIFGFTFLNARVLSALLTALSGGILLVYVFRRTRNLLIVNLMGLLFLGCGMILAWAPVIKTHPLNLLTLTSSLILLLEWRNNQRLWLLILTALLIGIGVNARLTLGPFLILYAGVIFFSSKERRWSNVSVFTLVVLSTSLPTFYFFISDPQRFIQYNLLYHTQVYPGVVDAKRRLYTAQNFFLQGQIIFLVLGAQIALLLTIKKGRSYFLRSDEALIGLTALLFIIIHLGSAEPYTQYFVALVPLLLMLNLAFLQAMLRTPKLVSIPVLSLAFILYLYSARADMNFEIASMTSDRPEWSIKSIQRIARALRRQAKPGETCLTWWPGFSFMAGCQSARGMENHMRNYAVQKIPGSQLKEYQMMSDEELLEDIEEQKYRLIVDNVYHIESPLYGEIKTALEENYLPIGNGVLISRASLPRVSHDISGFPPASPKKNNMAKVPNDLNKNLP